MKEIFPDRFEIKGLKGEDVEPLGMCAHSRQKRLFDSNLIPIKKIRAVPAVFAEFAVFFAFFVPFVLLALCFAPSISEASRYDNERFGFSVDVSDPEFVMLPPSANGDGIAFQSRVNPDVSILFFGRNQRGGTDTIEYEARQQTPDDGENVFFTQNRRDFHLQYDHDGLRTETLVFLVDGVFYTGMSVAPVALRELYNPKFHGIFVTWKIRGNPTVY